MTKSIHRSYIKQVHYIQAKRIRTSQFQYLRFQPSLLVATVFSCLVVQSCTGAWRYWCRSVASFILKERIRIKRLHTSRSLYGFCSNKRLGIFLLPPLLDGMLVNRSVTPSIQFAGTHLYTWEERGTVRVRCLAQEHNTMSPARARTRWSRYGVERTNHFKIITNGYQNEPTIFLQRGEVYFLSYK